MLFIGTEASSESAHALLCHQHNRRPDANQNQALSRFSISATHGNVGAAGGAGWFLQKALPPQLVSEIFFDAQPIHVPRLQAAGVVNKVAADGAALDQALAWAEHLALTPAAQFVQIKTALSQGATDTLSEIFTAEKHNLLTRI
ncbi:hypothetical protein PMI16_00697 [Herbaspirillum sp. CF444]|uniref:enoyl-CoA hydratase-related protein n=1 Tax=Herbaspirillum sp. CF444 TaxID=1144319 RepID=UPI0002723997|nr:enoyl-CoA hydratase-related protein [Herbaspirillum sp. CF444]EJL93001.1 hypothetical protein PMI16_00697 [Herbaspirillum sp. CF444]